MKDLGGKGYTAFERELLFEVFDAPKPAAGIFRKQIAQSRVTGRRYTGAGSYTDIAVDRSAPTALGICGNPAEQRYVVIWRPGLDVAAGCVVFVDDEGFVNCLEVYTNSSSSWEDEPDKWLFLRDENAECTRNPFDRPN